jgi:hypothetical protein
MIITYKEGEHTYADYFSLEADYVSGKLHPSDLKPAVTNLLNKVNLSMMRLHVMRSECLSQLRLPPPVSVLITVGHVCRLPLLLAWCTQILQPVRDHFSSGEPAKLLATVKKYKITK